MTAAAVVAPGGVTPEELRRISLPELYESPLNPRTHYDAHALEELADSLLASGQLTPIIVRPRKGGGYELAAGHRRRRAAMRACQKSPEGAKYRGLDALLAVIRPLSEREFIEVLNIENLQRDDLHPLEEAQGFRVLMEKAGYDVAKIAARIGRSTRYVYDSLTLLKLSPQARKLFLAGTFERGHAVLLARLTPADQGRAIGDLEDVAESGEYAAHRVSLLLRPDNGAEGELPLHDRVKSVSVREFQHAIQTEIRATPERVDPFLFPESAAALESAKEEKLSVIHITREYRVSDEARDEKIKTYGEGAWERADVAVEEEWGTGKPVKSRPCAFSRYGFVAAGPGQGEVFRVCINKDKCKVHWPEQVKRAEARKKGKKTPGKPSARAREDRSQEALRRREQAEHERVEAERARWRKAKPAILKALAARLVGTPAGPSSRLADDVLAACSRRDKADTTLPRGRSAEDFLRHAAFQLYAGDVNDLAPGYYLHAGAVKNLRALGIDAATIVDEVEPKAQPTIDPKKATCPQCGAKPGSPCKRPSGHNVFGGGFHAGRGKPAAKPPAKRKGGRK